MPPAIVTCYASDGITDRKDNRLHYVAHDFDFKSLCDKDVIKAFRFMPWHYFGDPTRAYHPTDNRAGLRWCRQCVLKLKNIERAQTLLELIDDGMMATEAARELGICKASVWRILKDAQAEYQTA